MKYSFQTVFITSCPLVVPILFGFCSIALRQDTNWDMLNYHLYNPYSYLHDRLHLDLAPAGLQTYFNPLLDVIYFIGISTLSPKSMGFIIGLIQGISFIFIYKIAAQILGKEKEWYAFFLAIAGLLSVGFISEIGTVFHDSSVGVLTLAALWLTMLAIECTGSRKCLALTSISGALMGIACSLKLVFSIYALALLLGLLLIPIRWNARLKLAICFGVCAFFGLLLVGGDWFFKVWSEFGNPLFPQFNHIFHSELATLEPIRDTRFMPKNLYEKLFYPILFTIDPLRVGELPYKQWSWIFAYAALFVLGGVGLVGFFRSTKVAPDCKLSPKVILLVSYFGISYFLWLNIFGIYRYLIPVEVLIPLLLFITIHNLFKSRLAHRRTVMFLSLITLINLPGAPSWGHSGWSDTVYRVELSALTASPEPAAVYLADQPLAWIIPALGINAPFIQIMPNMPVTDAYWSKAKGLTKDRSGKQFVIFESQSANSISRASVNLAKLGLALDENICDNLVGYIGAARHKYRFCELKRLEG